MKDWLLTTKMMITFFCVATYFNINSTKNEYIVLIVLIYSAINIVLYVLNNKKWIELLQILSLIICLISTFGVHKMFLILAISNIYEIIYILKGKMYEALVINLILGFFVGTSIITFFSFIAALTYIIYYNFYNNEEKMLKYEENIYNLRIKNETLNKSLNKDFEYESQIKYMSQLEERNKIAQEIHDNIGHTISGTLMQLEATKYVIDKDKEKSKELLQNSIDVLRDGMESIRITLRNIKPPKEQIGINEIKLIINKFKYRSGINVNLIFDDNIDKLSFNQWKTVKINLKEILTNAIKYSKAANIIVSFTALNRIIKLEIKDDGVGCLNLNKGLGFQGIEERCENLNIKVIIDGSNGFSVIMLIPISRGEIK
ncbi:histidine kinase [Clostridium grantii]|uniref:histidine kinase n=1 Tax=Clostridium grantii DSM 8605 TaxID=1121316 RepID=A0A1M5WCI4_9CLOT|nr:histidine kinase [Clostridium grantii]SHH84914.1 Histidine kinase [Clostridium grantii DSM 8605]